MPLPLVPLALLGAAAFIASQSSKKDTTTNPNTLFDVFLPPAMRKQTEDMLVSNYPWPVLIFSARGLQDQGYNKTSQTVLAVANSKRATQALPPIGWPISDSDYAMAVAAAQGGSSVVKVGPSDLGVPGPGGTALGIPPKPDNHLDNLPWKPGFSPPHIGNPPATPPGPTPGFVPPAGSPPGTAITPLPGGGVKITVPGLGDLTIPPGILGAPPELSAPPATIPGGRPPTWPTTVVNPPGTFGPPPNAPPTSHNPPPASYGSYPAGTHSRPDGTAGYTTQKGDYSTVVIAKKFGGSNVDLLSANPGVEWTKNYPGTDLNLPPDWIRPGAPPIPGPRGKAPPTKSGAKIDAGIPFGPPPPPGGVDYDDVNA